MQTDNFSYQEKGGIFSWYILNLIHFLDWTTGLTLLHYKSLYHTPKFTTAPCVVELNMEAFIWPIVTGPICNGTSRNYTLIGSLLLHVSSLNNNMTKLMAENMKLLPHYQLYDQVANLVR